MNIKLNIYSDKSYTLPNVPHTIMLFPFWGISDDVRRHAITYQKYADIGTQFFEMTSIENADLIVAPVAWEKSIDNRQLILDLAQFATPQKPIIIFFWHDSDEAVAVSDSIIFRTSFYKSTQQPNEFAMPAWSEDVIQTRYAGQLILRDKQEMPIIGFCGYAMTRSSQLIENIKDIGRYLKDGIAKTRQKQKKHRYHVMRGNILQRLSKSQLIKSNFIIRNRFHGAINEQDQAKHQQEYIENMITSDYMLCVRGAGNFSYRLYETLACGRIPVFINTDCVLPYDFIIDWKKYCVWLE